DGCPSCTPQGVRLWSMRSVVGIGRALAERPGVQVLRGSGYPTDGSTLALWTTCVGVGQVQLRWGMSLRQLAALGYVGWMSCHLSGVGDGRDLRLAKRTVVTAAPPGTAEPDARNFLREIEEL